nr:hypothetical protein [Thermoflexales bacterium]
MTTLDELTDDIIAAYASSNAFARGRTLYQRGAVQERLLVDDVVLDALVQDGKTDYTLQIHFEGDALLVGCECREGQRNVCAHIVAVLLAWVHEPDSFEREDDLDADDLADFDLDEVVDLEMLPPAPATASAPPLDAEREVANMLGQLTVAQLRELAARYHLTIGGTSREPFIKPLSKILSQPEAVRRAWPTLSRPAQKLLGTLPLMRSNNLVFPQQAKQAFQMIDGKAAASFAALLRELTNAGLVFAFQQQLISVPSQLGMVLPPDADYGPQPDDVVRLKPQTPAPAPLDFASLTMRLALVLKANPDRFTARQWPVSHPIEQQYFGLAGWPHYPAELDALKYEKLASNQIYGKSFGVPPAPSPVIDEARDELAGAVGVTPDRLDFALRLLIAIGLVKAVPQQPLSLIERAFNDWLTRPLLDRANRLFTAYANLNTWTELDRLSELHHP